MRHLIVHINATFYGLLFSVKKGLTSLDVNLFLTEIECMYEKFLVTFSDVSKKNSTICHPLCLKMQNRNYLKIAVRRGPCRRQYLIRFRQIGNIVFWNLIYAKRRLLLKFWSHIITAFNYCIAILAKSIFNIR